MQTLPFLNSSGETTGTFSVGDTTIMTITFTGGAIGQYITVYIIHVPSSERVFSSSTVSVQGASSTPNALLSVTAAEVDSTHYVLTISHEGGDDLNVADLQVQASSDSYGDMQILPFLNPSGGTTGTFYVGMQTTIDCTYTGDVRGQVVTVYIIHVPSKEKMFSSSSIFVNSPPLL